MARTHGSKRFCEYQFQAIDHTKKRIIYCDDHTKIKGTVDLILPIAMRRMIGPEFKGYKIHTQ